MIVDKELLNKIAKDYHLNSETPDMFIENTCQKFELNWVKKMIKNDSSILDLGFGDGLFLKEISTLNETTLLEGSSELASIAEIQIKNFGLKAKVVNTLFEDFNSTHGYDVVIASHVLEHVDDPIYLLNKIKTWLHPDGILICVVPNRESLHRRLGLKMGLINKLEELSQRDKVVGHQRVYSFEQLKDDLNQSGFEVKEARGFFTKTLANSQMLQLSEQVIWGLCELSEDLPVEMGANIGIVANLRSLDVC